MSVSISKEPARIASMFDGIAKRYDTLNHLLSAGFDKRWRRRAVKELRLTPTDRVLDVCTGTADLAIEAIQSPFGGAHSVVGVDFSGEMLKLGLAKVRRGGLAARIVLARGDATNLPVPDASFDAAMVAFGIRNVVEPERGLQEFLRVLKPGGRLAILELGLPRPRLLRALYQFYFRRVLPQVGKLISRHNEAYSYLPASVADFPSDEKFAGWLRHTGFTSVRYVSLTAGVVYLYVATKGPDAGPTAPSSRR